MLQLDDNPTKKITELIEQSNRIAVIPSKVSGADAFSAAAGLYYMLKEKNKDVVFIHTGKAPEITEHLIKKDDITSNIFQRELLVSIDYSNTPAAQVHYSTENDVLVLKLSPIPRDFDRSRVKTNVSGFNVDLVITLGVQQLEDLGQVFRELENELRSTKTINIDNTDRNRRFGSVNLIDTSCDNLSLVVYKNAPEWGMIPTSRSAKALLTGMTYKEAKVDYPSKF
jgi:nanoRNase/pAp phosphatase (c-di-AMP/oligoRNAs hydrolase)